RPRLWPPLPRCVYTAAGRRVRGGAGCAPVLVLLPPAGRGAAAGRAGPYRGGGPGRTAVGGSGAGALGGWGTWPVGARVASRRAGAGQALGGRGGGPAW